MTRIVLTAASQLRDLPDGAVLTAPGTDIRIPWIRAYAHTHHDEMSGLWTLPRNPFAEYHLDQLEADLPVAPAGEDGPDVLTGEEAWLSTLDDPHDSTRDP